MIFLTVGNQLPFDRLVSAVDDWLGQRRDLDAKAQIGDSGLSPEHLSCMSSIDAGAYADLMARATHVIAHAGMGTVISARLYGKPLLVMPRQSAQGEVRSDHQIATCRFLEGLEGVWVAWDTEQLLLQLPQFLESDSCAVESEASREALMSIRGFVQRFVHADRGEQA